MGCCGGHGWGHQEEDSCRACGCCCPCACGCDCCLGGFGFRRRFRAKAERKELLEAYREELKKELAGVEEAIQSLQT